MVVALTLIMGSIPVSAATTTYSLTKASKTIYLGGCKGYKENGTKAPYYSYITASKYINNYDESTQKIVLTTEDPDIVTVNNKKGRINAAGIGVTNVTFELFDKDDTDLKNPLFSKSMKITVKKNATEESLVVKGIEDGAELVTNKAYTVSVPRDNTVDTDLRRLVCDDDEVVITASGTRKWKVKFTEPGEYILYAEAYQSATYAKATITKAIEVIVEEAAAPTPTPTKAPTKAPTQAPTQAPTAAPTKAPTTAPTQAPTAAPTATPTPAAPAKLAVQQLSSTKFKLTGSAITAYTKASDISFSTLYSTYKINQTLMPKNYIPKDGSVEIELYSAFSSGTTYVFGVGDEEVSFVGAGTALSDVKRIEIVSKEILFDQDVELDIRCYTASGVDITEESGAGFYINTEAVGGDTGDYYVSGKYIHFTKKDASATIKATLITGMDQTTYQDIVVSTVGSVYSYQPHVTSTIYTFTDATDSVYLKSSDTLNVRVAVGDTVNFEALFTFSDGTTKNLSQAGVTGLEFARSASKSDIAFSTGTTVSGGYSIYAFAEGSDVIIIKAGEEPIATVPITVSAARKVSQVSISQTKSLLNTNSVANDSITFTAKVTDQYNQPVDTANISVAQATTNVNAGSVAGGYFTPVSGKPGEYTYTLQGTDVTINSALTIASFQLVATCDNVTRNMSFQGKNSAYSDASIASYGVRLSTTSATIDKGAVAYLSNASQNVTVQANVTDANGFYLTDSMGAMRTSAPTAALKCTDLGVSDGTTVLCYTIDKNGTVLTTLPAQITYEGNKIVVKPFTDSGDATGLAVGTYKINVYKITARTSGSSVSNVATCTIVVKDSVPSLSVTQVTQAAPATGGSWMDNLSHYFKFYVNGTELKLNDSHVQLKTGTGNFEYNDNLPDNKVLITKITFTLTSDNVPGSKDIVFSNLNKVIEKAN